MRSICPTTAFLPLSNRGIAFEAVLHDLLIHRYRQDRISPWHISDH